MKLTIKVLALLFLLSFISKTTERKIKTSKSRISDADYEVPQIYFEKDPDKMADDLKKSIEANAQKQTDSAQNLLSNPNDEMRTLLSKAASYLLNSFNVDFLSKPILQSENITRVVNKGIYDGKQLSSVQSALNKVIGKTGSAKENTMVLSFLGDIGASMTDFDKNKTDEEEHKHRLILLGKVASTLYPQEAAKKLPSTDSIAKFIQKNRGGTYLAPNKKGKCSTTDKDKKCKKPEDYESAPDRWPGGDFKKRSGVFNKGKITDISATWPFQRLRKDLYSTSKEPWVGHMSGSICEVMMMLDIATGVNPLTSFENPVKPEEELDASKFKIESPLDSADRKAKAALASAFIIGIGYHSALEVAEPVNAYLGVDFRKTGVVAPGSHLGTNTEWTSGKATKEISSLMDAYIKK